MPSSDVVTFCYSFEIVIRARAMLPEDLSLFVAWRSLLVAEIIAVSDGKTKTTQTRSTAGRLGSADHAVSFLPTDTVTDREQMARTLRTHG